MKTIQEKIEVMQAYARGEKIESSNVDTAGRHITDWYPLSDPHWDWEHCDYRVASPPVEGWVEVCPSCRGEKVRLGAVYKTKAEAVRGVCGAIRIIKIQEIPE